MKKFTLLMSALMLAAGAVAQVPEGKFIIATGGATAREHGKYMAVTAEGRLITTNTIDNNALWEGGYNDDFDQTISNVGVKGYLYEGSGARSITLSATPKAVAVMESLVLPGAYGITTNREANPTDNYDFLNALNTDSGAESGGIGIQGVEEGSSFFLLAYDPNETEEQIAAKVTDLYNTAKAKGTAIEEVNKYMNASWGGRKYGEGAMYEINYAETEEELAEAVKKAKQAAVTYAERSLTDGATMFNVRTGQVITYTGVEANPVERTQAASIQSLWVAEPVEGDPIEVDGFSFKSFYLRNAANGKYIAKTLNSAYALGSVDTKDEAGTMNLVMGNTGFEIVVNNNGSDKQYLNVSSLEGDTKLTIWAYDNDGGAFFEFNQLPTFESTVLPMVKGLGEIDETTGSFKMINAVEIYVPVGAQATGVGNVALKVYNEDWTLSTVDMWSSEAIAGMTPETKTVEYPVYNEATGEVETATVEAHAYTLITNNYITNPGSYIVSVAPYAFSLTTDAGTTFSPEVSGNLRIDEPATPTELIVTPEAGTVESITTITIDPDGVGGWMVGANVGNITVTFNGEIANAADGTPLDLNGDAIAVYDAFDTINWTGGGWEIPVNFTAPGKYVLTIPAGFFDSMNGVNEETIVEWIIDDKSGIKEITSKTINGRAYDLKGRAVANPVRGLFIINGKKVIK